jgi:hypothetical protein
VGCELAFRQFLTEKAQRFLLNITTPKPSSQPKECQMPLLAVLAIKFGGQSGACG